MVPAPLLLAAAAVDWSLLGAGVHGALAVDVWPLAQAGGAAAAGELD
jgi:hypothetical protein